MRAGDVVDGRFELLQWVGAGGMGEVFRARDMVSGEDAALKVLMRAGAGAFRGPLSLADTLSLVRRVARALAILE